MLLAQRPGQSIQSLGLKNYQQMGEQLQLGQLSGDPNVAALQAALINLSRVSGNMQINPGPITGIVDGMTIQAVLASTQLISGYLPTWAGVTFKLGMFAGAAREGTIQQMAVPLTVAVNTAAAKFGQGMPIGVFSADWWMTPIGLLVIAGIAFAGYKLLIVPSKAAAKAA